MKTKPGITCVLLLFTGFLILHLAWHALVPMFCIHIPVLYKETNKVTHTTTKQVYKPGEKVCATVIFIKKQENGSTIQWNLHGPTPHIYDRRPRLYSPDDKWKHKMCIERLPVDIIPGKYSFNGHVKCNSEFGVTYVPVLSNEFTVE